MSSRTITNIILALTLIALLLIGECKENTMARTERSNQPWWQSAGSTGGSTGGGTGGRTGRGGRTGQPNTPGHGILGDGRNAPRGPGTPRQPGRPGGRTPDRPSWIESLAGDVIDAITPSVFGIPVPDIIDAVTPEAPTAPTGTIGSTSGAGLANPFDYWAMAYGGQNRTRNRGVGPTVGSRNMAPAPGIKGWREPLTFVDPLASGFGTQYGTGWGGGWGGGGGGGGGYDPRDYMAAFYQNLNSWNYGE